MLVEIDLFNQNQNKKLLVPPFKTQLLKWIGNKQRFSHEIASYFPADFNQYFEPFLGSGAVLATLSPPKALASDIFEPLMEIWETLSSDLIKLKKWYSDRWDIANGDIKKEGYEKIKASYNNNPNGADFLLS